MNVSKQNPGENARMYAHRVILNNIINLELPPGSAISENELSQIIKVSRTPVREALIEMSRLGLVEILPQRGSFVAKIDYDLIEESRFIRLSLENSVLRLACEQGISPDFLNRLHQCLKEQKLYEQSTDQADRFIELDNEFHRIIFESVNKIRTYEFITTTMVHFDRLRMLALRTLKEQKNAQTINDHENILYALEKRDRELAEMVMSLHLTRHQVEREELYDFHPDYFV